MLNDVLKKKIQYPDVRFMYETGARLPNPKFREELIKVVRAVRNQFRVKSDVVVSVLTNGKRTTKLVKVEGTAANDSEDTMHIKVQKFKADGSWYRARVKELEAIIFDDSKRPPKEDVGKWRSIEFEMVFKNQQFKEEFIGFVRKNGWTGAGKTPKTLVTMKTDGSVHVNRGDAEGVPVEMVLSYKKGNEAVVKEICKFLRGKAYVNKTCGTHVHFDMRHMTEAEATKCGQRIANCIPALWSILPKSRSQASYCKAGISKTDRYSFVNMSAYQKYATLEVRAHSGTINARKILNWIAVCDTIMFGQANKPAKTIAAGINDVETLTETFKFDESVASFIRKRFEHFNNKADLEEDFDDHNADDILEIDVPTIATGT